MKRIGVVLLLCAIFVIACNNNNAKSGPFCIVNDTDTSLNLLISANQYDDIICNIDSGKKFNTNIYYYTPEVKVIKDSANIQTFSNRYKITRPLLFDFKISENSVSTFSVINKIPDAVFNGDDVLYFFEKNKKMDEWSDGNSKIKIDSSTTSFTVSCFTANPKFQLISESGEWKCNGYSVTLKNEDGIIYLY